MTGGCKPTKLPRVQRAIVPMDSGDSPSDSSDSSDESVRDSFPRQPDTDSMRAAKSKARWTHRSKLEVMTFQQTFLKPLLPETYKGEEEADAFEKFTDQLHNYAKAAYMNAEQAITLAGSRCSGNAY